MTTYGTIPATGDTSGNNTGFFSRAKERLKANIAMRRPAREMWVWSRDGFSLPESFSHAVARVNTNASYFRMNYAIYVFLIVCFGLTWQPISRFVFIAMTTAWLLLYFLRDEPLVVYGRTFGDREVVIGLSVATIAALILTDDANSIISWLSVGVAAMLIHGVMRKTEDLVLDEEVAGGWSRYGYPAGTPPAP